MSNKFTYTRLLVSNFKECFLFYRDMMGFKATFGSENDVYADFDTGEVTLALFSMQLMSEAVGTSTLPLKDKAQDTVCLCFEVENVDAACQSLTHQGVELVTEPTDRIGWGIRVAHFRDPAGNLIEINQPLAHS
ncbi:MAG TPA: VOC family protein [Anaerolineales bacterium]|nr:VOC family protein [Anaerolineales bacterium]